MLFNLLYFSSMVYLLPRYFRRVGIKRAIKILQKHYKGPISGFLFRPSFSYIRFIEKDFLTSFDLKWPGNIKYRNFTFAKNFDLEFLPWFQSSICDWKIQFSIKSILWPLVFTETILHLRKFWKIRFLPQNRRVISVKTRSLKIVFMEILLLFKFIKKISHSRGS